MSFFFRGLVERAQIVVMTLATAPLCNKLVKNNAKPSRRGKTEGRRARGEGREEETKTTSEPAQPRSNKHNRGEAAKQTEAKPAKRQKGAMSYCVYASRSLS